MLEIERPSHLRHILIPVITATIGAIITLVLVGADPNAQLTLGTVAARSLLLFACCGAVYTICALWWIGIDSILHETLGLIAAVIASITVFTLFELHLPMHHRGRIIILIALHGVILKALLDIDAQEGMLIAFISMILYSIASTGIPST